MCYQSFLYFYNHYDEKRTAFQGHACKVEMLFLIYCPRIPNVDLSNIYFVYKRHLKSHCAATPLPYRALSAW